MTCRARTVGRSILKEQLSSAGGLPALRFVRGAVCRKEWGTCGSLDPKTRPDRRAEPRHLSELRIRKTARPAECFAQVIFNKTH